MIRIIKGPAPQSLATGAAAAHQKLIAAVRSGSKLRFRKGLYAAKSVKDALVKAQNGKCAFCESQFLHVAFGDVEHFRPKGGSRQSTGGKLIRPGYYWLAYDWGNLFLSCQLCNQQFKENLFPLRDPKRRCRKPNHDLTREGRLLVDPQADNPAQFIAFRGETVAAKHGGGAVRGKTTIKTFGLNRDELKGKRMEVLQRIRHMVELRDLFTSRVRSSATPDPEDQKHLTKFSQLLDEARLPAAEYSAMAVAFLR